MKGQIFVGGGGAFEAGEEEEMLDRIRIKNRLIRNKKTMLFSVEKGTQIFTETFDKKKAVREFKKLRKGFLGQPPQIIKFTIAKDGSLRESKLRQLKNVM